MTSGAEDPRLRDRMRAQSEIARCEWLRSLFQVLGFVLAVPGVIAAFLGRTVLFSPRIWLLPAIFASLNAVVPTLNLISARRRLAADLSQR